MTATYGINADRYVRCRPPYPEDIWLFLDAVLEGPRRCAVDLGAGAGLATTALLGRFEHVVAVEPDVQMAENLPPHERLEVRHTRAENSVFAPQTIDAVITATAFHWMERQLVCHQTAQWLRAGGIFYAFCLGLTEVVAPVSARRAFEQEREHWSAVKDQRLRNWRSYGEVFRASGAFTSVQDVTCEVLCEWPAARVAGFFLSTSDCYEFARRKGNITVYETALVQKLSKEGRPLRMRFPYEGAIGKP